MTPSLVTRVSNFLSDFLAKFFKDGLPVALAGAIGALVVGQVNRPAPIVVQAPPAVIPQPAAPERVDHVMREPEAKPVAAREAPAKASMAPEERKPRAEKLAKPPARQVPEKKVVVVEAPPVASAVPPAAPPVVAAVPAAPLIVTPPPPPPPEPRATEWVGLLPLPTRVTGTVDRAVTDAPVPPMPVPEAGARM